MLRIWSFLIMLLFEIHSGAQGYMIDDDCGDDRQFVHDRIEAAFRLIENTVTELNKNPIDIQVDNLHDTLFARRFDASSSARRNIKTRFEHLLRIRQLTTTDQTAPNTNDVRFYCTVNRIEKKKGKYINKDRNIEYKEPELSWPGGRFANCFDLKEPTLMITLTISNGHSEIQICPWFLTNVRGFKFGDLSSLGSSFYHLLSKIAVPVAAMAMYTPIDSFSLMDKTIVHELTHTDQVTYPTRDIQPYAYGFRNAQRLAASYRQDNTQPDPFQNADSNSLFAVGTWIIAKGGGPINADGTFGAPQATPKARI